MNTHKPDIHAVLFDLDGTLLDTAPDLVLALNKLLTNHNKECVDIQSVRNIVSQGSVALTRYGFPEITSEQEFELLRQEFLQFYLEAVCSDTRFFDGIEQLLSIIEAKQLPWGIVTNKPTAMTEPLLRELAITPRTRCVVCGDTLQVRKPHPEPLFYACDQIGVSPHNSIYIGDDLRDIYAGNEAGMYTCIAEYGYIETEFDTDQWGADFRIHHPLELLDHIMLGEKINDLGA